MSFVLFTAACSSMGRSSPPWLRAGGDANDEGTRQLHRGHVTDREDIEPAGDRTRPQSVEESPDAGPPLVSERERQRDERGGHGPEEDERSAQRAARRDAARDR